MKQSSFFQRFAHYVIRWRWPVLLATLALAVLSGYVFFTRIQVDNSFESYFVEGDPHKEYYDQFKKEFGEDTFIYILYQVADAFDPKTLAENHALSTDLAGISPQVRKVLSITTAEVLTGEDDELVIRKIGEDLPQTPEDAAAWRARMMTKKLYRNALVSGDGRFLGILMPLDYSSLPDTQAINDAKVDITHKVRGLLEGGRYGHLKARVVGDPVFNNDLAHWTATETNRMIVWTMVLLVVMLLVIFRRPSGVLIPLTIVGLAVVYTFGAMALFAKMRMTSTVLPPLLLAVGIADSIHLLSEFDAQFLRLKDRRLAIMATLRLLGYPCLLTSVTTAAGFLSLMIAPVLPLKETGVLSAFGVMAAYGLTITLVVALLSFGGNTPTRRIEKPEHFFSYRFMGSIAAFTRRFPRPIVIVHAVITAALLYGVTMVQVDTDWITNFGQQVQIRRDYEFVKAHMGAVGSIEMVVDTGREGGAKDPVLLKELETLVKRLEKDARIKKIMGLPDIICDINRALHQDDDAYLRIPDTQPEVAQVLLLYENAGGDEVNDYINFSQSKLRISLLLSHQSDNERRILLNDIEAAVRDTLRAVPAEAVHYTGLLRIAIVLSDMVIPSQVESFLVAFAVIALMLMIFFRSFTLGLVGMIPASLPVFLISGLMGYCHINLDWVIAMIAPIGIGLSVDNTIHLVSRFKVEFDAVGRYRRAMDLSLSEVGRALTFSAFILMLGYGVTTTSIMNTVARFGAFSGLIILVSIVICVILAPVILVWQKPFGPERDQPGQPPEDPGPHDERQA